MPRKMSDEDDEATAAEPPVGRVGTGPESMARVAGRGTGSWLLGCSSAGSFFLKKKNWILSSGCWVRSWFLATFLLFLASVGFQSGGGKWFSFHRHYVSGRRDPDPSKTCSGQLD